jgi:hypothetical protein
VWNSDKSSFAPPLTPTGAGYADLLNSFDNDWTAGQVSDLHAGLVKLDGQVADQLALGTAP